MSAPSAANARRVVPPASMLGAPSGGSSASDHSDHAASAAITASRRAARRRMTAAATPGSTSTNADTHGHREARKLFGDQDPGGADRMDGQEAACHEEPERQQEHARVAAAVGRLTNDEREQEGAAADGEEQHEVQPRAVPGGIELTSQEQRAEADERDKQSRHPRARDQRA